MTAPAESGNPLILLYHSVVRVNSDPFGIRVTPRHFAEHMADLAKHCRPMRLDRLRDALLANDVPPRSVVVTFDDGFADNLHHAKPVLDRYGVPATIFVASGYVGQPREGWWDEIDRILLQAGNLPQQLRLNIDGRSFECDLGDSTRCSRWNAWRNRRWKFWQTEYPTPRHRAYHDLWEILRVSTTPAREAALNDLREWAGIGQAGRGDRRFCTVDELRQLASGDLIEIGAHTVSHPSLAAIPLESQRREISDGKVRLEEVISNPVTSFAYPYGTKSDYSIETIQMLRDSGFQRACSNFPGVVSSQADHFQWPRRVVSDWSGAEFVRRLANWLAE